MKSLEIGAIICELLLSNEELKAKINGNVTPLVANAGTIFPFIVYRRASVEVETTKDLKNYSEDAQVEIIVAAENYQSSIDIVKLVHHSLEKKKGSFGGIIIKEIKVTDASEEYRDDAYVQTLKINIKVE